ncbi:TBC1 domain family member 31-like isoform X1 [Oncorhynchus masou masou]|uniref:TBC1 domain family member 31-like isoform X1 n=1 Tax=Oncorhynchus masou masou TaxID=90313 RepID=UPI0031839183
MKRELKVKELQLMDAARRRFLKQQQDQRLTELHRLDEQIQSKMNTRDQETAAAVQDIQVRQMELEAQRRLFEQRLAKEQVRVTQEVRAEVDTRRHRSEVEETTFQHLLNNDTDVSLGTKKVLEECLAEAGQLGVDTEWQAEVMRRLDQEDAARDRHYHHLAGLHRETLTKEQQLVNIMEDVEGQRWEEVVSQKAQLEEQRQAAATAEANRRVFLSQEEEENEQHRDNLRRSQDHSLTGQQWEMRARSPCSTSGLLHNPVASPGPHQSQQHQSQQHLSKQPVHLRRLHLLLSGPGSRGAGLQREGVDAEHQRAAAETGGPRHKLHHLPVTTTTQTHQLCLFVLHI